MTDPAAASATGGRLSLRASCTPPTTARSRAARVRRRTATPNAVTLDDDDIEAVAARVVELLRRRARRARGPRWSTRRRSRACLDVDRDWVYANARRLGAVRLGDGPKARLRFDVVPRPRRPRGRRARATSLPRTSRDARRGGALAGSPCRPVCSSSRGGLACERGPCNAPSVRSRWSGGCANTPGPGTGGIFRCKPRSALGPGLMARPRTGTLRRTPTGDGVVYGVQFSLPRRGPLPALRRSWEGWDDDRAERERRFLMEKVNRGEWTPPARAPVETPRRGPARSFQLVASEWLHRQLVRIGRPGGRHQDQPRPALAPERGDRVLR